MTFLACGSRTVMPGLVPCCVRSTGGPFSTLAPDLDPGSVNGVTGRPSTWVVRYSSRRNPIGLVQGGSLSMHSAEHEGSTFAGHDRRCQQRVTR
jgi:hypothetical protein